eukprot:scaffold4592_cov169-Ochromonas_danica.AAC.3
MSLSSRCRPGSFAFSQFAVRCLSKSFADRPRTGTGRGRGQGKGEGVFSVDRSGLYNPPEDPFKDEGLASLKSPHKETASPLAHELSSLIQWRGPISMHEYMALSLHHSQHGYYHSNEEKIGQQGDFVTAPELSQLFGEMLGLWCYTAFLAMGSPKRIYLTELGPGKGTLMQDMLRVAKRFPAFRQAMRVQMVEASQSLRRVQQNALSISTPSGEKVEDGKLYLSQDGVEVVWQTYFHQTPQDAPFLVIGQEFLDAFPVHQFVYTTHGWREKLIDIDGSESSPYHFRVVLANKETPAAVSLLPRFVDADFLKNAKEGQAVEICPLATATCAAVAQRIMLQTGAGLFIDYGLNHNPEDSLRSFYRHSQRSVLSLPGQADMTADVDFAQCRRVIEKAGATALPLQTQGHFLASLGIVQRAQALIDQDHVTDEQAESIVGSLKMLLAPDQMGEKFKVLGVAHPSFAGQLPGFGAN